MRPGNREQEGGERVATDFTFEFGLKAEVSIVTFGLGFYSGERLNADEDQGGMTAGCGSGLRAFRYLPLYEYAHEHRKIHGKK